MRRATAPLTAIALMAALAGCVAAETPAGRPTPPTPAPTTTGAAAYPVRTLPYELYTHCGVDEAQIAGHWYEAVEPLSDGNDNPPAGWGNPYQVGTMRLTSPTEAEFRDQAGHAVRFRLRPGATEPKRICS
jgi:hypothetical protein